MPGTDLPAYLLEAIRTAVGKNNYVKIADVRHRRVPEREKVTQKWEEHGGILNLAGWNERSHRMRKQDVECYAESRHLDVLVLTETLHMKIKTPPKMKGFMGYSMPRKKGGGAQGISVQIRSPLKSDLVGEKTNCMISVRISGRDLLQPWIIIGVYVPVRAYPAKRRDMLDELAERIAYCTRLYPQCPISIIGDWNMETEDVDLLATTWPAIFQRLSITNCEPYSFFIEGREPTLIDHILTTKTERYAYTATIDHDQCSSDHRPIRASFEKVSDPNRDTDIPKRVYVLPDRNTKEAGRIRWDKEWSKLANYFSILEDHIDDAEDMNQDRREKVARRVRTTFCSTTKKILAKKDCIKTVWPKTGKRMSMNLPDTLKNLSKKAMEFTKIGDRARKQGEDPTVFYNAAKMVRADLRQREKTRFMKGWKRRLLRGLRLKDTANTAFPSERGEQTRDIWRFTWECMGKKPKSANLSPIRHPVTQELCTSTDDIAAAWTHHYKKLAEDPTGKSKNKEFWGTEELPPQYKMKKAVNSRVTMKELCEILKTIKSGKAPGLDEIPNDLLKYVQEDFASKTPMGVVIWRLINILLKLHYVEGDWAVAELVSIFKKGDAADCNDYRGISLISVVIKLACRVVITRISQDLEENGYFIKEQAGFRHGEECVAQAAALYEVLCRRRAADLITFVAFIDFKKAFDMVPHEAFLRLLYKLGIRDNLLAFIRQLYETSKMRVKNSTIVFLLVRGCRQGCVMSPDIFKIFVNDIFEGMEDLRNQWGGIGVTVPGIVTLEVLYGLLFADDTALLAESNHGLQRMLDQLQAWATHNGMEFGLSKCMVICFRPDNQGLFQMQIEQMQFNLAGGIVPLHDETGAARYVYLGVMIDESLDINAMPKYRLTLARRVTFAMETFFRASYMPILMKTRVLKSVVIPTGLYGSEIWGMSAVRASPMQSLTNLILRWSIGISGKSKFVEVRALWRELGLQSIYAMTAARKARALCQWLYTKGWMAELLKQENSYVGKKWAQIWSRGARQWIQINFVNKLHPRTGPCHFLRQGIKDEFQPIEEVRKKIKSFMDELASNIDTRGAGSHRSMAVFNFHKENHLEKTREYLKWPEIAPGASIGTLELLKFRVRGYTVHDTYDRMNVPTPWERGTCPFCNAHEPEDMSHVLIRCKAWKSQRNTFLEPHLSIFREVAKLVAAKEALIQFGKEDWRVGLENNRGVDEVVSLLLIGACPTFMQEWGSLLPKSKSLDQQKEVWEYGDDRYNIFGLLEVTHVTRIAAMEQDIDLSEVDSEESIGNVSDQDSDAQSGSGLGGPIRGTVATFDLWEQNKSIGMDPKIATLNFLQRITKSRVDVFKTIRRKKEIANEQMEAGQTPATPATPIDITHPEDTVHDKVIKPPRARRSILPIIMEETENDSNELEMGGGNLEGDQTEDSPASVSPKTIEVEDANRGTDTSTRKLKRQTFYKNPHMREQSRRINLLNRVNNGKYSEQQITAAENKQIFNIARIYTKSIKRTSEHAALRGGIHKLQTPPRGNTSAEVSPSDLCTKVRGLAKRTGGNSRTLSQSQNGKTDQPIGKNTGCKVGHDSRDTHPGFLQAASPDSLMRDTSDP